VYGVHVIPFDNYTGAAPEVWAAMAEAAEKETKERSQRLNEQLKSIEYEVVIGAGNIREVISNLIKHKEIDLIVFGTRGVGKGATWLSRGRDSVASGVPGTDRGAARHSTDREIIILGDLPFHD
jgi:nucleotide-binding universal stress UspA family protein